jgi:hypothetical protein
LCAGIVRLRHDDETSQNAKKHAQGARTPAAITRSIGRAISQSHALLSVARVQSTSPAERCARRDRRAVRLQVNETKTVRSRTDKKAAGLYVRRAPRVKAGYPRTLLDKHLRHKHLRTDDRTQPAHQTAGPLRNKLAVERPI